MGGLLPEGSDMVFSCLNYQGQLILLEWLSVKEDGCVSVGDPTGRPYTWTMGYRLVMTGAGHVNMRRGKAVRPYI